MAKFKFHKMAAIVVLIGTAAWVATGEFSSVGSAADQAETPAQPPAEKPEATIRTVAVVAPPHIMHSRAIRVSGSTEADKRAKLTTRAGGIIEELPVALGQHVNAGDLILKLDAEGREQTVATAKTLVAQREAEYAAAKKLAESGNMAALSLQAVESALASARQQLEAALADLGRIEVRAPFAGVVDTLDAELGATVGAGGAVATLLSLDPILAVGEVSERDLGHIHAGQDADVRLVDGNTVKGKVRFVSSDATAATRTFKVQVAVENPDNAIPAGMTAEITLLSEPVDSVLLPRSVITLSDGGDLGIRAVDENNKVVFYPIDLVDDTPEGLVLAGIPQGARIIVAGQEMVSEGDTVDPVQADQETINKLIKEATGGTD